MADIALTNAEARLQNVETDLAAMRHDLQTLELKIEMAEAERDKLHSFISAWYEMAGMELPQSFEPKVNVPVSDQRRTRPKNPDRSFVAEQSIEIIRENGEPMPRKPLFDALAARGIVIRGKDPEMVLSTMLWREKEKIVRLPQFGYWPADTEYRKGTYYPTMESLFGVAATEPEGGVEAEDAE